MITTVFTCITAAFALATALVRWRHEVDVREVRLQRQELDDLKRRFDKSLTDNEVLRKENERLCIQVDQLQKDLGTAERTNAAQRREIAQLRLEVARLEELVKGQIQSKA